MIFAGTDDGLIQVTEDGGKTWRKLDKFPGVPERSYVSKLVPSGHDGNTVYASFDNHKESDFKPYLLKSTDAGQTWTSIAGDLPERGTVYCLAEDHVDPNLLFCGTEFGLYVTKDGGKKWLRIRDNLPTIQVKDLVIQQHNNDLVIGTFGRGIYVIDDYSHLRTFTPEVLKKDAHLFPPSDAVLYAPSAQYGGGGKAFQGASFFTADNPPFGATFLVPPQGGAEVAQAAAAGRGEEGRQREEGAAGPDAGGAAEGGRGGTAERDADRHRRRGVRAGHRLLPDRRGAPPRHLGPARVRRRHRDAGTYKATLGQRVGGKYTEIAGPVEFKVVPDVLSPLTEEQYAEIAAFNKKARALQRALTATTEAASDLVVRLERMKTALDQAEKSDEAAKQQARDLIARVKLIQRALSGDSFLSSRNENTPASIAERAGEAARANRGRDPPADRHPETGPRRREQASRRRDREAAGDPGEGAAGSGEADGGGRCTAAAGPAAETG